MSFETTDTAADTVAVGDRVFVVGRIEGRVVAIANGMVTIRQHCRRSARHDGIYPVAVVEREAEPEVPAWCKHTGSGHTLTRTGGYSEGRYYVQTYRCDVCGKTSKTRERL